MVVGISDNVDIVRHTGDNLLDNKLIDAIVQNLVSSGKRYEIAISGSPTGKESQGLYYENLDSVIESVYSTIGRSNLATYRGCVYFFTGKIYEPVPSHSHLNWAMRTYLRVSGVPKAFIVRSIKDIMAVMYTSLNINRVLSPRYNVMAFENGVVDMKDGVLRPFSRDYHVLYLHKYKYDPSARCPKWLSFLRGTEFGRKVYSGGVLPDKNDRTILQMFLGLALYDRGTMDKKVENALVLFGNGSNGKSVIMNTVTGILGEENISNLSMDALLRGGDERQRNLSQIEGKIFNWSGEMEAKTFAGREDAAKSLISGEPQLGRRIGNDAFKITNIPYFIFNANHFPTGTDSSFGFFRRFIFIVFDRVIDERHMNLKLTSELREEYPGILNWIRRGAALLKRNGFKFPESEGSLRKRINEMGLSALGKSWALARGFFALPRNGVSNDMAHEIDFAVIYDDIKKYSEENGYPMASRQTIAAHFRELGFGKDKKRKVGKTVYYKCYGLTTDDLVSTSVPLVSDMSVDIDNEGFQYGDEDE